MNWARRNRKQFPAGSTLTLSKAVHDGAIIKWDTLTGSVVTLPPALGTGFRCRLVVTVLATSNSHKVQVANSTDIFNGIVHCLDSDLATVNMFGFAANGTNHDTITLDRTNTGSVTKGEYIDVEDIAAGVWHVVGTLSGAAPATPFSSAV